MAVRSPEVRNAFIVILASLCLVGSTDDSLSPLETLLSPRPTARTGTATDRYITAEETEMENPTPEERMMEGEEEYDWPSMWTRWSEWSTCSTTVMRGFRVRSRVCPKRADCFGDDVQLMKCNEQAGSYSGNGHYKFSHKYIDQCKKRNKTEKSLSCKLYLENPDLAYDIFRQNSCFFTVNSDDEDLFPINNQTAPIPRSEMEEEDDDQTEPRTDVIIDGEETILSVNSNTDSSVRSDNLIETKQNRIRKNDDGGDSDSNGKLSDYSLHVLYALIQERKCKAYCDNTMNQAARLWALGTRSYRSAENIAALLNRNGRLVTGVAVMFYEYNKCVTDCHSLGTTYSMLSGKNKNNASANGNLSPNLKKLLKSLEEQSSQKKRQHDGAVESLCGGKRSGCVVTPKSGTSEERGLQRRKRQASQQYESPCFSHENQVPAREIERKANAELFFFEDYVQRFTCRKCRGIRRGNTGLFLPKEQVRQQRNNKPAYCRQGFLKRHALFIVENPNGRYAFNTGEKFSIESRTFDVESHCEIVILK